MFMIPSTKAFVIAALMAKAEGMYPAPNSRHFLSENRIRSGFPDITAS